MDSPDVVWSVHLANGNAIGLGKGDAALVWPVRGGNERRAGGPMRLALPTTGQLTQKKHLVNSLLNQ